MQGTRSCKSNLSVNATAELNCASVAALAAFTVLQVAMMRDATQGYSELTS